MKKKVRPRKRLELYFFLSLGADFLGKGMRRSTFRGDSFITGADTSGAQYRQKPVLVIIFLEKNQREFPEIITSTGAKLS